MTATTVQTNQNVILVEVDVTVPSASKTLTEADYSVNGRTAIPKSLGTKEGIFIHNPSEFTPFESMRNSVRNTLLEFGVKPGKSNVYAIPASRWTEAKAKLDELEARWEEALEVFKAEYYEARDKFHKTPEFKGWDRVLARKIQDLSYFVPRFDFYWEKKYESFDSSEEMIARMDRLGDKLLNEVVQMADKVMKTSIIKRAANNQGMTTRIRFPLTAISNKLKSWVSLRPEVQPAIDALDALISQIPVPGADKVGMDIAQGSQLYKAIADLVTQLSSVDGVLGAVTADEIKQAEAEAIVDALNETLEAQGEETVSLPDSEPTVESEPEVENVEEPVEEEMTQSEVLETATFGKVEAEEVTVQAMEQTPEASIIDEDDAGEEEYAAEEQQVVAQQVAVSRRRRAMV